MQFVTVFSCWRQILTADSRLQRQCIVLILNKKKKINIFYVCMFLQYVHDPVVDNSDYSSATVAGHVTSTFPLLHSVSVVDP